MYQCKGAKTIIQSVEPLFYLAPALIVFGLFLYYPMARTIHMSMSLVNSMGAAVGFTGLKNYLALLTDVKSFWPSLWTTVKFVFIVVPLQLVSGVLLGLLAQNRTRKANPLRTLYALPMAVSSACASIIWLGLFNPATGLINHILRVQYNWMGDKNLALIMIAIVTIWLTLGMNFIYAFSGLQGVPRELYESAAIEGAGFFRTFWHVTFPCISPTLFFLLVTNTIGAFQTFTQVNLMTAGGPGRATFVLAYSIYREAFLNNRWGYACAQSIVFLLILLVVSICQFRLEKNGVFYQ
jgi:sn-glycerol 3-phosphate transport system permease protein